MPSEDHPTHLAYALWCHLSCTLCLKFSRLEKKIFCFELKDERWSNNTRSWDHKFAFCGLHRTPILLTETKISPRWRFNLRQRRWLWSELGLPYFRVSLIIITHRTSYHLLNLHPPYLPPLLLRVAPFIDVPSTQVCPAIVLRVLIFSHSNIPSHTSAYLSFWYHNIRPTFQHISTIRLVRFSGWLVS